MTALAMATWLAYLRAQRRRSPLRCVEVPRPWVAWLTERVGPELSAEVVARLALEAGAVVRLVGSPREGAR